MRAKTTLLFAVLSLFSSSLLAIDTLDQKLLDFAKSSPPTEEMTLSSLAQLLRTEASTEIKAAELTFYWITEHIAYDFDSEQISGNNDDLERVLRTRRGNVQTFSQLYREVCIRMGLECHLIRGYVNFIAGKELPDYFYDGEVKDIPDKPNHSWNLVKIEGVYYGVDVSLGSGAIGGTEEEAVFVKKYDPGQILVSDGIFFKMHLPADPRWQFREHPIAIKTFFTRVPFEQMLAAHESAKQFDYQAAIAAYEKASAAEQRLMTLKSTLTFNPSNFNLRQYADALYNMGYTQSLGDYNTDRLLSARRYYQQAIDAYKRVDSSPAVDQLMAQAEQGITYIAYRLDSKK